MLVTKEYRRLLNEFKSIMCGKVYRVTYVSDLLGLTIPIPTPLPPWHSPPLNCPGESLRYMAPWW
jgi:hypothetical protein